jgi:hypothetical protein
MDHDLRMAWLKNIVAALCTGSVAILILIIGWAVVSYVFAIT